MVKKNREQLWVWLDSAEFGPLQRIGTLSKGDRGNISFAYHADWLKHAKVFPLDPELDLTAGEFYPANGNFGIFMDSCPDRWGQTLMERREAIEAQEEKRVARTLGSWDLLLGVQDCTRMGALRFSRIDDDNFLADEALSAPPITSLAELQAVAFELSKNKQDDLNLVKKWLQVLVAPGSSLGGARPKANVLDKDGQFWIAKFPAADDDYDVAAWEKVLHDMARDCAVDVPKSRIEKIGNK
ncbi:MAG: type II toxin-antitoxin system HipA family toxin [Desulfuromusa sp.]|nr:type II toxin-antitoxin system HipA family toxin [Desulfuromusa sp.]